jgi:hypothetical protein
MTTRVDRESAAMQPVPLPLYLENGHSKVLRNVCILRNTTRRRNPEDLDFDYCCYDCEDNVQILVT